VLDAAISSCQESKSGSSSSSNPWHQQRCQWQEKLGGGG
jgi:hypothetical protein